MNSKPLVSVIIIFFNEEQFIRDAIESVFAQTYDNWELLVADDGSTDGSTEIARRYAEQYPGKVRYLEHEGHQNRGTGASRSLGVRNAKGEYIAFLDADDVWLPHKLKQQVAILDSQPEAAMVYGAIQLWYSWTGKAEDIQRDSMQELGVPPSTLVKPPTLLTFFLARKAITPCPSDVLVRHEIVESVGGFEESFRSLYEDQVFFAKVCLKAAVFVSSECWVRHRQHPNSLCSISKRTGAYYSAQPHLAFLNWMKEYLDFQGVNDPAIRKVLKKRLWRYRHPVLFRLLRHSQHLVGDSQSALKRLAHRSMSPPFRRWIQLQRDGETK